jgi:hypothetical protein
MNLYIQKETRSIILNSVFGVMVIILILASIFALLAIHLDLLTRRFTFSLLGLNNYLLAYGKYSSLFAGTIATTAAYSGIQRLKVAAEANQDKVRLDRYSDWKTILDIRFIETDKKDPLMKREFIRLRFKYFSSIYPSNFSINTYNELIQAFDIFKSLINFFESSNEKHIRMGGVYLDANYSFSFDSFRFLFLGCIDSSYDTIELDLKQLYINQLSTERIIDAQMFRVAQQPNLPSIY